MESKRARNRVLVGAWLQRERFTVADLASECRVSRQMLQHVKSGRDVRLSTMVRILHGARSLAGRNVAVEELFDFDSPDYTNDVPDDTESLR
jgi:predicted transcriptional regulator